MASKKSLLGGVVASALIAGVGVPSATVHADTVYAVIATGGELVQFGSDGTTGNTDVIVTCTSDVDMQVTVQGEILQGGTADAYSDPMRQEISCGVDPVTTPVHLTFDKEGWLYPDAPLVPGAADLNILVGDGDAPWASIYTTLRFPSSAPPPAARPGTPTRAHTTVGSRRAVLHWAYPASSGGAAINRYQVQRGSATSTRRNVAASSRAAAFPRLKNGHRYAFYVRAHNRVGFSRWVRAYGTPKAPPRPRAYRTCAAMHHGLWPHGVGRAGARDRTSGTPVTNFKVSTAGYRMNDGRAVSRHQYDLDRDNDGIACESR